MPKFRFHRGSLKESLAIEIEVKSVEELCNLINQNLECEFSQNSIIIEYYCFDNRLNKDLFSVKVYGFGIIGYLDSNFL